MWRDTGYWDDEAPEIIRTKGNVIRYYKKAQRLIVQLPDYIDSDTGKQKPGKCAGLRLDMLTADERKRLAEIITG